MSSVLSVGIRYIIVGGTSVLIYVGCAAALHRTFSIDPLAANAAGYALATLFNYLANFYWAFATQRTHTDAFWRFLVIVATGIGLNSLYATALVRWTNMPIEAIAVSFAILWPTVSFTMLRLWALR